MRKSILFQNKIIAVLSLIILGGAILNVQSLAGEKADYIFKNAAIYTVNDQQPWAEAIAVKKNKIIYVGTQKGISAYQGKNTKIIDATGKMILPGFIDSHVHPIWGGTSFINIDLKMAQSKKDVQEKLKAFRVKNPNAKFIAGGSWKAINFENETPHKNWIDAVVSDIPVLLVDHFGHTAWANSKALELAAIDKNTVNPEGGSYEHDVTTGELTGIVREVSAFGVLQKILPINGKERKYKAMKSALKYLNQNGITSFVTAYMVGDPLGATFEELYENNELTARTVLSFKISSDEKIEHMMPKINKRRAELEKLDKNLITANMVKIFLDGTILNHMSAMLEPFDGEFKNHNHKGYLFSDDQLKSFTESFDKAGFQLHFHTVGDGAARQALDMVENLNNVNGKKDRRPHISHLTIVSPDDYKRFGELGVYANSQFYWLKHQEIFAKVDAYMGEERSKNFYPYGGILQGGATLAGGSDWPVSTANPFAAMEIAATRPYISIKDKGDAVFKGGKVWLPEHKVDDVKTLIKAFTINGAKLQFREDIIGSLEVGKMADLIMIDQNILKIPLSKLHTTKINMTMFDGKIVFQSN